MHVVCLPSIDTVLFYLILFREQGERGIHKGKKFGFIVIPVVINEKELKPEDSAFNQIIKVVGALGQNDARIIDEFREIAICVPQTF